MTTMVYTLCMVLCDTMPGAQLSRYTDTAVSRFIPTSTPDTPTEYLAGSVERVTFHSEETGFCVLRVKVRGQRDLVTVVGTAPPITPGEYIEGTGW
jgi:hypothetical protein